jgi:bacterioferritin (cytochrome b1)
MSAVNQQFIHVLALRDWGYAETADRIMEVDGVDFPNAMRIIDYLVEANAPILLAAERPVPGTGYRSILAAEQAMEQRLCAVLEQAACKDDRARALVAAAKAPRDGYAAWLTEQLKGPGGKETPAARPFPETAGVFAHLIATIEQTLAHAFLHWHRGDRDVADAAWATSGAAMMQATAFVRLFAAHQAVPVSAEPPALRSAGAPATALDFDRELAGDCAREAAEAAERCNDVALAELCRRVAAFSSQLSHWRPGETHPAAKDNPAAFSSFEATLRRFVWPRQSAG